MRMELRDVLQLEFPGFQAARKQGKEGIKGDLECFTWSKLGRRYGGSVYCRRGCGGSIYCGRFIYAED